MILDFQDQLNELPILNVILVNSAGINNEAFLSQVFMVIGIRRNAQQTKNLRHNLV